MEGQSKGGLARTSFSVSKLFLNDLKPDKVQAALSRFLEELDVDYLDLLLIHWPNPDVSLSDALAAMTAEKEKGLVRGIGVSNFVRRHLQDLAPFHFPIITNQIEMHPYFQRKPLVSLCRQMGIPVTAYRPLAKGAFEKDSTLQKIGQKYKKSPSQVALRWLVQQDIVAIPKAGNVKHLKDNLSIFDFNLDQEDLRLIDGLDSGTRYCAPEGFPVYND